MIRPLKRTKFGLAEDPTGQIVMTNAGKLYDCVGMYYREFPTGGTMLRVRHFNGESAPDICSGAVKLVLPDETDDKVFLYRLNAERAQGKS